MDTLTRLKSVPLFASLAPDALARVAQLATRCTYPKGSFLYQQAEHDETLYVIDSGEAIMRQIDGRGLERPVAYLREGDVVGEDALLLGDAYDASIQATKDLEALAVRKSDLDALLKQHPHIERQLVLRPLVRERLRVPSFPWLLEKELPLLLRRRHWIVLVRNMVVPLLAFLVLGAVALLLSLTGVDMSPWLVILLVGIAPTLLALWYWADWRNDFYLITNQRIVHRERLILLYESWDEAPLDKIQNTDISRSLLGNLLKYGNVRIETASARGYIMLDHMPDPEGTREVIDKQVSTLNGRLRRQERDEIYRHLLVQTGRAPPVFPEPQTTLPPKKLGILARFAPARPVLRLRYQKADRIVWRKHWIFLLRKIWLPVLAVLLVTAVGVISLLSPLSSAFGSSLLLVSLVLWVAAISWLLWEVEDWRNDEYIVTDGAIIDVQKKPLFFAEQRKQAGLDKIENVSFNIPGVFANLMNYGDVVIQTAGASGEISFHRVPQPAEVQREIFRRMEAYNDRRRRHEREQRKAEMSTWFEAYDHMAQEPRHPSTK